LRFFRIFFLHKRKDQKCINIFIFTCLCLVFGSSGGTLWDFLVPLWRWYGFCSRRTATRHVRKIILQIGLRSTKYHKSTISPDFICIKHGDLQYIRRGHSGKAKISWDKAKTDGPDLFSSFYYRYWHKNGTLKSLLALVTLAFPECHCPLLIYWRSSWYQSISYHIIGSIRTSLTQKILKIRRLYF